MSKSLVPLGGYNNNVAHHGHVYHLQTEDSGAKYARIVTHLFADGGRIVSTTRTDYHEHLEAEDAPTRIHDLMRRQHRAMYVALRSGQFDQMLSCPPPSARSSLRPEAEEGSLKAATESSVPPLSLAPSPVGEEAPPAANPPKRRSSRPARRKSSSPPARERAASPADRSPRSPTKQRGRQTPVSFSLPPAARVSIFGETTADERPLDDAILTYLYADTDDSS